MDKRDPCIDFLKGECKLKECCRNGHYLIPDKDKYILENGSKVKKTTSMIEDKPYVPKYVEVPNKDSTKKPVMNNCDMCNAGLIFDEMVVKRGELQSYRCKKCIEDPNRVTKMYTPTFPSVVQPK